MRILNLLALSGSNRAASFNTALLHYLESRIGVPVNYIYSTYPLQLPHFNPDEDNDDRVHAFRQQIAQADGVLICTPEYAFGVPGTLKNALDWTVSSGSLDQKPVLAFTASPLPTGGDKAMAALLLTLKALGTTMDSQSSLCIPMSNRLFDAEGRITDDAMASRLDDMLQHLLRKIDNKA